MFKNYTNNQKGTKRHPFPYINGKSYYDYGIFKVRYQGKMFQLSSTNSDNSNKQFQIPVSAHLSIRQ